jgi:hypothetical protein
MGFIEETGAAQYMRDARITTIYEGTTGIQANDLMGRKIAREGGATVKAVIAMMRETQQEVAAQPGRRSPPLLPRWVAASMPCRGYRPHRRQLRQGCARRRGRCRALPATDGQCLRRLDDGAGGAGGAGKDFRRRRRSLLSGQDRHGMVSMPSTSWRRRPGGRRKAHAVRAPRG